MYNPTLLIMLCTDKGSMVQAQYCSEWTELWYGTLFRFLCYEMTQPELSLLSPLSIYGLFYNQGTFSKIT